MLLYKMAIKALIIVQNNYNKSVCVDDWVFELETDFVKLVGSEDGSDVELGRSNLTAKRLSEGVLEEASSVVGLVWWEARFEWITWFLWTINHQ